MARPAGSAARVELVEQLEPESFIAVAPADASVRIRTSDDYAVGAISDPTELVRSEARLLVLRVNADAVPKRDTLLHLIIDGSRAHLFDIVTGKAL